MLLDFNQMETMTVPGMNGGTGEMTSAMHMVDWGKVIRCAIHPGGSIGEHPHPTSVDVNYVLAGEGVATCDGVEEQLVPGTCHICPQGSTHSITNTGETDLVLLTVVCEQKA